MKKIYNSAKAVTVLCIVALCVMSCGPKQPARQMEDLGRGVVAVNKGDGKVFVSWRMFGNDPDNISFNLYRSTEGKDDVKLTPSPIGNVTWFVDESADLTKDNSYYVKPVRRGKEEQASKAFKLAAGYDRDHISIPLYTPEGYTANDTSVGDLDGDGEYEIVIHMAGRGVDNAFSGFSDEPIFQAYKLDGTFMWEINLGKNIREGAHYTQFMVYDLDGDGKAELVCKTADGTIDAMGDVIGDPDADWRETEGSRPTRDRTGSTTDADGNRVATIAGRIMSGPEYLTVFEGATGKALATVDYVPARGELSSWGDEYANRSERYLACVAYLDGVHPSVVMCRGYYARTALAAWDWDGKQLKLRWLFDTDSDPEGLKEYRGQGNHQVIVADVDGDGCDEIIYGAMCVNNDGTGLYSTGLRHGDAMHAGDLDPSRLGLEVFDVHETPNERAGTELRDARTGELIWGEPSASDNGRGVAFDIDPRHLGMECWSSTMRGLRNIKGEVISDKKPGSTNFAIWWDGDLLRELLNGNTISKWDWENETTNPVFQAVGCVANNSSKSNPCLSADILGDWREELIMRTADSKELRVYTTTIPTEHRIYTLMHDPVYRLAIAWQNVAYNQPPNTGFYLGHDMAPAPKPNIVTKRE